MNRELAINYLQSSGFSDEQIKAIEGAFTCDKCVYSTSEGCQYDDITETIPPFETSDNAISRQAVLKIIDGWYDNNRDTENIEDLIVLITYMCSVNPQKAICPSVGIDCKDCPAYEKKSEWQQDHEILKAYSDGANDVLDEIKADIEQEYKVESEHPYGQGLSRALEIIDRYKAEGSGEE
jgi:hypothetical protein